jgi:hypothetical protein
VSAVADGDADQLAHAVRCLDQSRIALDDIGPTGSWASGVDNERRHASRRAM